MSDAFGDDIAKNEYRDDEEDEDDANYKKMQPPKKSLSKIGSTPTMNVKSYVLSSQFQTKENKIEYRRSFLRRSRNDYLEAAFELFHLDPNVIEISELIAISAITPKDEEIHKELDLEIRKRKLT